MEDHVPVDPQGPVHNISWLGSLYVFVMLTYDMIDSNWEPQVQKKIFGLMRNTFIQGEVIVFID